MNYKQIIFFVIYVLIPFVVIPGLFAHYNNWYGLIGILFYYAALLITLFNFTIFLAVPLLFTGWYWYTYGFQLHDYVTVFSFCLLSGYLVLLAKKEIERYFFNILPEQEQNEEYNQKLRTLEERIERYRAEHPGEKITQDIIEQFKTDIFF